MNKKYKYLNIDTVHKYYKKFYNNPKNKDKEMIIKVIDQQDDPNDKDTKIYFSYFVPNGDLIEENQNRTKEIIHKDWLLKNKSGPYNSSMKAPYKYFGLRGDIKGPYSNWGDFYSFQICHPNNELASNCMNTSVWIFSDESKNIIKSRNKKKIRPSPFDSATLFKVGTIQTGNDGNQWIITSSSSGVKRWSKIKN
jgi:hypothetical protein